MTPVIEDYLLIEDAATLQRFYDENQDIEWMGIDTEFIGERRFTTLLCLIQVSTKNGLYLIDTLKIKDIQLCLELIQNPDIVKISHAGENDYKLLYLQFGIVPKNVFDTQIAAGFVGHKYPISFSKLVERNLNVHLKKGYTVSDWEARPMNKRQLKYALDDVIYLHKLWQILESKLDKYDRKVWAKEEFLKLESTDYYEVDPNKEALKSNLIQALSPKEQVFLFRLYRWRLSEAKEKNYSKEMILPNKIISFIVKNITMGRKALVKNRRIPQRVVERYWETFSELYQQKMTPEDEQLLTLIPVDIAENPKLDTLMEMIYIMICYKCHDLEIAPSLVMHRSILKKIKVDQGNFDESLLNGWRKELIGEDLVNWMRIKKDVTIDFNEGVCSIKMKD